MTDLRFWPEWHCIDFYLFRIGNQILLGGFFLPLETASFPVAEDWASGTAMVGWVCSATPPNALILGQSSATQELHP